MPKARQPHRIPGWTGWALAFAPAGWVTGTAVQIGQPALWGAGAYAALAAIGGVLAGVAWLARRGSGRTSLAALGLGAALLAFAVAGLRAGMMADNRIASALEGRDLLVTGVIDRMPARGADDWRFPLTVRQARLLEPSGRPGAAVRLPARVLVSWYAHGYGRANVGPDGADNAAEDESLAPSSPLVAGQRWRFALRLKAPHGNRNPHGFDTELWLWEQGVGATGYVRTGTKTGSVTPQLLAPASGHWIECARQWTRERIAAYSMAGDAAVQRRAGIVTALVTGEQSAITAEDWTLFRIAGVAHLVIISGLHITMFAWLASAALGGLWRWLARRSSPLRRNAALWLPAPVAARVGGFVCALLYALFSGWGVP
ncbi:MAG: ComEC/Rec2 family competence protein, partial [Burkholderiaceae bacterium]|nr:ComEC/Rec2 family competence protein [Burkholderiaceae bacterium]